MRALLTILASLVLLTAPLVLTASATGQDTSTGRPVMRTVDAPTSHDTPFRFERGSTQAPTEAPLEK